jgi:SAM-dependent methyltransferase
MNRTQAERSRDWYQVNARHYDRRNPGLPGDLAFYASLCHGARVLEIGAGTGRITEAIVAVARSVIAVDNAPAMLAVARRRLGHNPAVALVLADAGHLPLTASVDRIILAYRTVQHLEPTVRRRLWHTMRTQMAPQGMAAFDTWHGPVSSGHKGHRVTIARISTEELRAELVAHSLQVLGIQASFSGCEDQQSLTRVWLVAPQSEVEKSGEKFHEVLDTRGRRI